MADIFKEVLVKREIRAGRWFLDVLLVVTGISVIVVSMMYFGVLAVIPVVGVIFGVPFIIKTRWVEFEYILTNDELDIDQITGKTRRKRLYTIAVRNIELMAPMLVDFKDDFYRGEFKKTVDCSSNPRVPRRWFVIFNDDKEGRTRLVFEPSADMVQSIALYVPKKVLGLEKLDELEREIAEDENNNRNEE